MYTHTCKCKHYEVYHDALNAETSDVIPSHTALRGRHEASVSAKNAVVEASRRSRIIIIAVVLPSRNLPIHRASPKRHRKIKHVTFVLRPLCGCLVVDPSCTCRIAGMEIIRVRGFPTTPAGRLHDLCD